MSDQHSRDEDELIRLMDAVAESALKESDVEIFEEVRQDGQDPVQAAQRVRGIFRQAVKAHRQQKLVDAKEKYKRIASSMQGKVYNLPKTAGERLRLLASAFQIQPELQSLLTAQHRELRALTDEDVTSYLRQLQELGVLPPHEETEG